MGTVSAHNSLMNLRTKALSYCFYGARSRTRTGTDLSVRGILSPRFILSQYLSVSQIPEIHVVSGPRVRLSMSWYVLVKLQSNYNLLSR